MASCLCPMGGRSPEPRIREEQVIVGTIHRHTRTVFRIPFLLRVAKRGTVLLPSEGILAGCSSNRSTTNTVYCLFYFKRGRKEYSG